MKNELIVFSNPKSNVSEAFKTIRTNLEFSAVDEKIKSILVTSSMVGEGKSFVSANLAVSFAQNNKKTLIVDCDMRRGRQHKIFGADNTIGLSNLLLDDIESSLKTYIQKTKVPNLYILPMGIIPPNPSELLNSSKNKQLMKLLEQKFEVIIYDGVPTNGLADSVVMSTMVDQVVIVCSVKKTPVELLEQTKKTLQNVSANIAGVIVNRVPVTRSNYYDEYYR